MPVFSEISKIQAKLREAIAMKDILASGVEERRQRLGVQAEEYNDTVTETQKLTEKLSRLEAGMDRKLVKQFEDSKAEVEKVTKQLEAVTKNLEVKGKARYRQVEFLKKTNEDLRKKVREHESYISQQMRTIEELSFREEAIVLTREADKQVYNEEIDVLKRQCEEMEARLRLEQLQLELELHTAREARKQELEMDKIIEQEEAAEDTKRSNADDPEYKIVKVDFNPQAKKATKTDIQIDATEEWGL